MYMKIGPRGVSTTAMVVAVVVVIVVALVAVIQLKPGAPTTPSTSTSTSTSGTSTSTSGTTTFTVTTPTTSQLATTTGTGDQPFEWVSDIIPGSGEGRAPAGSLGQDGPWNHRVLSATSSDGLAWVEDGRIISDQASVPDAIIDKDGNIRVYYVDWYNGGLSVALSHDGVNWIYKKVLGLTPEWADPAVVLLPDGRYRLYASYMPMGGSQDKIISAISNYGISFVQEEGVRYQSTEGTITDPDIVKMGDVWRMFVSLGNRNLATVSNDGLNFSRENILPFEGAVSCTIPVENGYRMYYIRQGGIYSSFSSDGRNWVSEGLGVDKAADPTVIRLQNGTYKMFYKVWIQQLQGA
jgi:hypothetical protein